MNSGAPNSAVMAPTGSSEGAARVRASVSAITTAMAPPNAAVGSKIRTIEDIGAKGLHPVQKAWIEVNAPQCGYCQSGQIMQAIALLKSKPHPTDQDIEEGMAGNICRCGTYQRIRAAIKLAAEKSA